MVGYLCSFKVRLLNVSRRYIGNFIKRGNKSGESLYCWKLLASVMAALVLHGLSGWRKRRVGSSSILPGLARHPLGNLCFPFQTMMSKHYCLFHYVSAFLRFLYCPCHLLFKWFISFYMDKLYMDTHTQADIWIHTWMSTDLYIYIYIHTLIYTSSDHRGLKQQPNPLQQPWEHP